MEYKIELVNIPVSDVDRAIAFYEKAGFHKDADVTVRDGLRFVQLTPPGSACSISLGVGLSEAQPGSVRGMQMVVPDASAAREDLVARGVEVSDIQEFDWGRFVFFADPDGNQWAVQEITRRAA
jgi:predicted enzyme related to lactoylglutathione lyase